MKLCQNFVKKNDFRVKLLSKSYINDENTKQLPNWVKNQNKTKNQKYHILKHSILKKTSWNHFQKEKVMERILTDPSKNRNGS